MSSLMGLGVLVVLVLCARGRTVLWYTAICLATLALSLLTMGRMPADMPSARDPACRSHPEYPKVARRGLVATGLTVVSTGVAIALSVRYVHGL